MSEIKSIPFKIIAVNVTDFKYTERKFDLTQLHLKMSFGFAVSRSGRTIKCTCDLVYEYNGIDIVHINLNCEFEIEKTAFNKMLDSKEAIIIKKDFLQYIATITVGTARGEIHGRLDMNGSELKKLILPPINLTKILSEDLTMPLI